MERLLCARNCAESISSYNSFFFFEMSLLRKQTNKQTTCEAGTRVPEEAMEPEKLA